MSCAPFKNPLDNALSYLYTNKVIDENMNIKSNRVNFYLNVLEKQTGKPLFEIKSNKLVPIQNVFEELMPDVSSTEELDIVESDVRTEADYVVRMKQIRADNIEIWKDSAEQLPSLYNEEEQEYLKKLLDNGILKMRCGL